MKFKLILAAVALLLSHAAWADQLSYISKPEADQAAALIRKAGAIRTFCAPCHETTSVLVKVKRTEVSQVAEANENDPAYWELSVNGEGIDLAYAYAPVHEGIWPWRKTKWRNVASCCR